MEKGTKYNENDQETCEKCSYVLGARICTSNHGRHVSSNTLDNSFKTLTSSVRSVKERGISYPAGGASLYGLSGEREVNVVKIVRSV